MFRFPPVMNESQYMPVHVRTLTICPHPINCSASEQDVFTLLQQQQKNYNCGTTNFYKQTSKRIRNRPPS